MKFYFFHLMPYGDLDLKARSKYDSAWMVMPNSYYDPEKGRALYDRYIGELELGEELGFDGVMINEHHSTPYGLMPSPIVIASALARTTKNIKIGIMGSATPLREHPLALAEEHAMIDTISGGRLISGFVRGIGIEYLIWNVNPTDSLERSREAIDLIIRAWKETGPFAHEGKHYHVPYVNLWPRPYQQPHPPVWLPTTGSTDTVHFAAQADHRFLYAQNISPAAVCEKYFDMYRESAHKEGWTATSDNLCWGNLCYIAETDEQAIIEGGPHIEAFFNSFLPNPLQRYFPPGYTSLESQRRISMEKAPVRGGQTIANLLKSEAVLCGSAATVRDKIKHYMTKYDVRHFLGIMQMGTLPADLTEKSLRLFSTEIMPHLRDINEDGHADTPAAS